MLDCSGQSSSEVLGIAILSLAMLVFVLSVVQEKNSEAEGIANASMDSVQCNSISSTISNVYNNRAETEQVLFVRKETLVQRSSNGPGTIWIGGISCYYSGIVENDSDGLLLSAYTEYKFAKVDGKVSICKMPC